MNRRDLRYLLLIFVVIIAAYAQLAFGIFSTKWDNLSAFFPYRYTVSEWINSGHLPLWDPYQNLGYPMHANPQGAAWNPFLWIVSLFTTYTPYIMNLEVVFYLLLAGFGFYLLLREFRIKHIAAVISALAYALSGFSSGTLHMIGFTAAAGLLPWCILYLYRVLKEPNYVNVIPLVISVTFHLVAAYPAFSIILTYLFTGFTLYYLISVRPSRPKKYLILLSKNLILATILILCLSSPLSTA